ncbi:gluconate 2-dehydrogenase subunit 3 family protein [Albibacterium bauzanense]|uniref:Gluconate 2-dehydrogenase subunit 3-like protein n=1 Tax=Albibacterium bauzanense TaxID=653929 RepID=A0A4R1LZT0_9SPHI|nr:gluconate 2-dehydrogenase subunit 3 family protein [Albibacterium bauzanense]TCK85116.1 gluconate 2-dehydrogenase subunit 3-like protein [Albibacterium bauzanense]
MNRRDSLKALGLTAIGSTALLKSCTTDDKTGKTAKGEVEAVPGREKFEIERINDLNEEQFFDEHEMATIAVLVDIIIPKDEVSGSATDAGVPDFIEFIVKDIPQHQLPMRGGLKWLDMQCLNRFDSVFKECNEAQQIELIDQIAYPDKATPEMKQGVAFFSRLRQLTASGFYTTKIGIEDIGYKGNVPNKWEGVPEDEIIKYNL